LTYDAERRVKYWQNGQNGQPITSQVWFMYDGEGHRVEQYVSGGSGNHTYYLPGNAEEVTPSGTLVKYYAAGGLALGENTTTSASGISYLASDGLGSVSEALNQTGTATGSILYGPYGNVRYSSGTMPTAKGFTGQYADASTGLDYYGARYYDPNLGQFSTADTVTDGLNRYGYVKGNPETYADPSGHRCYNGDGGVCGGGGSSPPPAPPPTPTGCHSDGSCGCYTSSLGSCSGSGGSGSGKGNGGGGSGGSGKACPDSCTLDQSGGSKSQCDQSCHIQKAKDIASEAAWNLGKIGIVVSAITALLGVIAAFLTTEAGAAFATLVGIPEGVALTALAGEIAGEAAVLTPLDFQIDALAAAFGGVNNLSDGWWSAQDNVVGFANFVGGLGTVVASIYTVMDVVLGTLANIPLAGAAVTIQAITSFAATIASVGVTSYAVDTSKSILTELGYA
jgi:RHS repeat-associated protein